MRVSRLLLMLFFWVNSVAIAATADFSIDLHNIELREAVYRMTDFLGMNVVVSDSVRGITSLHLRHTLPRQALALLLKMNGLAQWSQQNIIFIGTQKEVLRQQENERAWRQAAEETEPLLSKTWQLQYVTAEHLGKLLQDNRAALISKRGVLLIDTRSNLIYARDNGSHLFNLQAIVRRFDVPVQQVTIEARLVSIDADYERELGLSFLNESTDQHKMGEKTMRQEAGQYSIAIVKLANNSLLDVKLAALENAGHAELISSPSLSTANQQSASIESGEEIPYQEVSESGGTAVVFKKAVLSLRVTPQVLPAKKILLRLQINQDRPSNKMIQGMPAISTRQIMTNRLIGNGQTIVLGGIYEKNKESGEQRLPFISQVPVIGSLFKQQAVRESKRELLIFVTPKIIA